MIEKGFMAESYGTWDSSLEGIHFGFNISRVFTLKRKNWKIKCSNNLLQTD
ncbi:MAG: hypothetical protein IPN46_15065 [Saprospiraceae bacterium]|nr:hypothetical protein [Saprospiraceae bacterium]